MTSQSDKKNIVRRTRSAIVRDELHQLHSLCGIYTQPTVVDSILDSIGWTARHDLSGASLLEPAIGDGAFLVRAAQRVVASLRRRGIPLRLAALQDRLVGYELHPREANRARASVEGALTAVGVHPLTARACARAWIRNGDFLLARLPSASFTHVAGNPPYVRWCRIPSTLRERYEKHLDASLSKGDLYIPFLHRSLQALAFGGHCGFLVSNRWRYSGLAEHFRQEWLPRLNISSETTLRASEAFTTSVGAYPSLLIATRRKKPKKHAPQRQRPGQTLADLGCTVRVGPALGHTSAFVLDEDEADAESSLLMRWMDGKDILNGVIRWRKRRVVVMHDLAGNLISLREYPRLKKRLERFRSQLKKRYVVRQGAQWYSPIDRIRLADWKRPKILVPELAKVPRCAIDSSGAIPAHGVYAIFVEDDNIAAVFERLRDGRLARALAGISPIVAGGYVRAYRKFLNEIRI